MLLSTRIITLTRAKALVAERTGIVDSRIIKTVAGIVCAYVSRHHLPASELSGLINAVHTAIRQMGTAEVAKAELPEALMPAVPIKKSIADDFIICLEDGKKCKALKRHLAQHYHLTPSENRQRWKLPPDYPMVAPAYAALRSGLAKTHRFGRKDNAIADAVTDIRPSPAGEMLSEGERAGSNALSEKATGAAGSDFGIDDHLRPGDALTSEQKAA